MAFASFYLIKTEVLSDWNWVFWLKTDISFWLKTDVLLLFQFQFSSITGRMGCVNGKPALTEEDLEFIANHTAITREEVDQQVRFLYPASISVSDFKAI